MKKRNDRAISIMLVACTVMTIWGITNKKTEADEYRVEPLTAGIITELDRLAFAEAQKETVTVKTYEEALSESKGLGNEIVVKVVSDEDVNLLAKLMFCENGVSDDEALLLTGIVVLKRVKSDRFPNTIQGVVSQKGQYACYTNGAWSKEPDERSLEMARRILVEELEKDYPDELVFQSEGRQGRQLYKHIGNQYFCLM